MHSILHSILHSCTVRCTVRCSVILSHAQYTVQSKHSLHSLHSILHSCTVRCTVRCSVILSHVQHTAQSKHSLHSRCTVHCTVRSTIPIPHEKCGCAFMSQPCLSTNCVKICALLPSYCCRKYIDNYPDMVSGISAGLELFVSCLSDGLVDIQASDMLLLSLCIIIANLSLSGIWLSLLYISINP